MTPSGYSDIFAISIHRHGLFFFFFFLVNISNFGIFGVFRKNGYLATDLRPCCPHSPEAHDTVFYLRLNYGMLINVKINKTSHRVNIHKLLKPFYMLFMDKGWNATSVRYYTWK